MATDVEMKPPPPTEATQPSPPPSTSHKKRKGGGAEANADAPEIEVDLSLPEPPSKRAKRALKKGKPLPTKNKDGGKADGDDKPEQEGGGGSSDKKGKAKAERSQFGIWIGNLPFTVTRTQLFRWFVENSGGAIAEADITRVNLPLSKRSPPRHGGGDDDTNLRPYNTHGVDSNGTAAAAADGAAPAAGSTALNKGFAYVDFATYEAQIAATALSETELDGRRVLIKDSKSFDGRPAKETGAAGTGAAGRSDAAAAEAAAAAPPAGATSTKVFVGNLGFETSEADLRRLFAPCGPVAWVKVATFPDNTEKCRGYGWVQFGGKTDDGANVTPDAAAAAAAAAVRGFVRIEEKVETEEDFVAEAEAAAASNGEEEKEDEDEDEEGADRPAPQKASAPSAVRTKTRKWWVNMLKGRQLKVQFAEDDVVRYKKRFGKGRPPQSAETESHGEKQRRLRPATQDGGGGGSSRGKPYKSQDLSIAQRTGAITTSLGKKTILE